MAKKKKARTAKQKAATKKMQRAAARARREAKHTKSPRKRAKTTKSHPKGKKKSPKRAKGRKGRKGHKGGRKGKGRRAAPHTRSVRTEIIKTGRHTTQVAIVPVPSRSGGGGRRKPRKKGGKKGRGRSRAREAGYVMENPLSGVELFVGAVTGLLGFGTADILDRLMATHTLTDKNAKDANGNELYADPGGASGTSYAGLFNATAVLAPMDWKRWGVGALVAGVPFILAAFIKAPMGRSSLQLFGFGALIRVGGKGFQDLMGKLFKTKSFGQRLYDGEMRASSLKAGDGSEASLPSSGLGAPALGCGACANCVTGVGMCCGRTGLKPEGSQPQAQPPAQNAPPPPPPAQAGPPQGVPVPVVPQTVPGPLQTSPVPVQVPPTRPGTVAPGVQGLPNGRRSPYQWGVDNAAE